MGELRINNQRVLTSSMFMYPQQKVFPTAASIRQLLKIYRVPLGNQSVVL